MSVSHLMFVQIMTSFECQDNAHCALNKNERVYSNENDTFCKSQFVQVDKFQYHFKLKMTFGC